MPRCSPRPSARPGVTVAIAVAALVADRCSWCPRLGTEFLPELDEGSITIQAVRDPSVSLTQSVAMQRELERTVRMSPEVTTVVSRVGRAEVGSDPMGVNLADVFVMLKPRSEWRPGLTKEELIQELTERLEERVPGLGGPLHPADGDAPGRADQRRAGGPGGQGVRRRSRSEPGGRRAGRRDHPEAFPARPRCRSRRPRGRAT